jgi:hypothetical protein
MNKTRRAFGLSGFGLGAALAGSRPFAHPPDQNQPRTSRLHEDPKLSVFEASLARGAGSEVLAAFGRSKPGSEVGDIALVRSRDGGATWLEAPLSLFASDAPLDGSRGYQPAALTRLSAGGLIACTTRFGFLFEGKVGWRRGAQTDGVFVRASSDHGYRWDEIRKVDTFPFQRAWTRGPIVEMPDGKLLLPLAGQKSDSYSAFDEPISSFSLRSDDGGVNWKFHGIIAQDSADFDEPAMISLGGPRLLCVLRSHQAPRRDPPGGYLYMASSADGGATWSKPRNTSMWGHPASLLRLQDGRVLCTYGYRMHPNPGVRACVSKDGIAWKPSDIFTVSASPDVDSDHLAIGCPSSIELGPGTILTAYQIWAQVGKGDQADAISQQRQCLESTLYRV